MDNHYNIMLLTNDMYKEVLQLRVLVELRWY